MSNQIKHYKKYIYIKVSNFAYHLYFESYNKCISGAHIYKLTTLYVN